LRSLRVLRNAASNYLRFFSGGLISFLLTPLMVHVLGDGGYGLWVAVFSLTGYFGLVDQGIRPSLVRYVARFRAVGDAEALSRTMSSALLMYGSAGVLTLAATGVAAAQFPHWFHIAPGQIETARATVLLAGASLALGFPFGVYGAALSGLQRYDIANLLGIAIAVLRALLFVVVLRSGGGLVGLALMSLIANLIGHVLTTVLAMRLMPEARYGRRWVTREHLVLIGSYSGIAFVGAIANSLSFQTDALVISAFMGAALVTPFALAAGLVDNVRTLVHSATWVLSPTASEMETLGEQDRLHAMLIAGAKYGVLISWPLLFALMIFGENLMRAWVGASYASGAAWPGVLAAHGPQATAAQLLVVLSLPTLVSLPQSAASSILYGVGRHRGMVMLALLNALLNLGLSLWWVRSHGLVGVALGTAVPLAIVAGVATALYAARALELPAARYLGEGMLRPGLASLWFVIPALLVQAWWRPSGWGELAAAVGGCWLVFAGFAWWVALSAAERQAWGRMLPRLIGPMSRAAASASGSGAGAAASAESDADVAPLPVPGDGPPEIPGATAIAPSSGSAVPSGAPEPALPPGEPDPTPAVSRPAAVAPLRGTTPDERTVTAVITCYNAAWCVERSLDSVFAQSRLPDEVLVADDGSTDDTVDRVAARYGDAVRILRLPHRGPTASRRAAVEEARGGWIAVLDADDSWHPSKLERQLAFLDAHPAVRWMSTDGVYQSAEGVIRESWLSEYFEPLSDVAGDLLPLLVERCFPLVSSSLFEVRAYHEVGGFDPSIPHSQDYDLWLKLAARYPGGVLAERLVTYWSSPSQLSRRLEERYRDDLRLMQMVARGQLRRAAAVQRVAARRVSAYEFELGVTCLRSGRVREGRVRLARAARGAGPAGRRLLAACGAVAPHWSLPRLMHSGWIKEAVRGSRHPRVFPPARPEVWR
jgi:O-antigen/teichoic acid export membrane protein